MGKRQLLALLQSAQEKSGLDSSIGGEWGSLDFTF
jgi:hypothetical protein